MPRAKRYVSQAGGNMPEEKSEAVNIGVRISPELAKQINELIEQGKHTTISDVVKTALIEYVNRQKYHEQFHDNLLQELEKNPQTREALKDAIKELWGQVRFD